MTGLAARRTALVLAAAALAAAPGLPREAAAAPTVHRIVIAKMKFGPAPRNLRVGDTIVWVNQDMFRHTATARDRSFNLDLPPSASARTVIRRAGAIPYYCIYHPGMTGRLTAARQGS
jgi:plastocyanin